MAIPSESDVRAALISASESLIGRRVTDEEKQRLATEFKSGESKPYQRAVRAIEQVFRVSEVEMKKKSESSDNIDRKVQDLRNLLDLLDGK